MPLSIEQYDRYEADALETVSNVAREAFAPSTFLELGSPTTVSVEADFLRFIDTMHEVNAGDYFKAPYPLSLDEADLIRRIGDHVADWSQSQLQRRVRPWVAPLSALEMFRVTTAMAQALGKTSVTVLEIGPGSGYFGALLHLAGHRHVSMDITQAYYLWQNRLFESLAGDGFADLANPETPLAEDPSKSLIHLPWWRFVQMHATGCPFQPDLVICDHALNEISTVALRYMLRIVNSRLATVKDGMLLFCYPGHGQKRDETRLFQEFDRAGFEVLIKRLFYAAGLKTSRLSPLAIPPEQVMSTSRLIRAGIKLKRRTLAGRFPELLSLDREVPRYNPSGRSGLVFPAECVPIRRDEAPPGYDFLAAAGYFVPPFRE